MIEVTVTEDWSDAFQAWSDIQASVGFSGEGQHGLHIYLWEGAADANDFAHLMVEWGSPGYTLQFSSAPSSGTAYIVGVTVFAQVG